jgi:hypothetical protein
MGGHDVCNHQGVRGIECPVRRGPIPSPRDVGPQPDEDMLQGEAVMNRWRDSAMDTMGQRTTDCQRCGVDMHGVDGLELAQGWHCQACIQVFANSHPITHTRGDSAMATYHDLRPYGPGKFNTMLDAAVWEFSLDGCDEATGDVETTGWYGLLRGPLTPAPNSDDLTPSEQAFLRAHPAGAILSEDGQGFVTIEYYRTPAERDRAWARIEQDTAGATDDDDAN